MDPNHSEPSLARDRPGMFGHGTSGEGCDTANLSLPGEQPELVEAVLATGTPTILIAVSGCPYALGPYAKRAAAILQAFLPGEESGPALAEILTRRINPPGELSVQIPRRPDINPSTYLHPYLTGPTDGISNLTDFTYGWLRFSAADIDTDGTITPSLAVTNTGTRRGVEVVQLYLTDPVARVAHPIAQSIGFAASHSILARPVPSFSTCTLTVSRTFP